MGASFFQVISTGSYAQDAFEKAIEKARDSHGRLGYTGTIAEKKSFTMIECPANVSAFDYINELVDECDSRIDDKWGPAGCIKLSPGNYVFFGWASE